MGIDMESGESRVVANLGPPLDNLAVGPDAVLYVSRPSDNSIFAVNPKTGGHRTLILGHLAAPGALIVDPQVSQLLVADVFGYRMVDPATGAVSTPPFDLFANGSTGIAADENNLVISNLLRSAITVKDRKSGKNLQLWTSVKTPMHLAIRDGRILAADFSAGEIVELSLDGPKAKRVVAAGLAGPVGLAVAQDGRLIVSEALSGRLVEIDPRGKIKTIVDGLRQPEGLALDAEGNFIIAEVGARRVIMVQLDSRRTQVIAADLPLGSALGAGVLPVNLPTGVAVAADGSIYVNCDINNSNMALRPAK